MPQIIFSFTINTETQDYTCAGNVPLPVALQMLQQLVITDGIRRANEASKQVEEEPSTP